MNATDEVVERAGLEQESGLSIYHQLGIDYRQTFLSSGNRPVAILNDGAPIEELL